MSDKEIRAFIAIELPPELRVRLGSFQKQLKQAGHNFVKWVAPESIHLTLKFLGNIGLGKVDLIKSEIRNIAENKRSFKLFTAEVGCFPNPNRMRVFWLGLGGEVEKLIEIQREIDESLTKLGFTEEVRPFSPHLTLARSKDVCLPGERREFAELIKGVKFEPLIEIKVESLSLMRSQLTPVGAIYNRLAEFKFKESEI